MSERLSDEWAAVFNAMPEGKRIAATTLYARCPWWPRSYNQFSHALRQMAKRGLLAKPSRGVFVRRTGSIALDDGYVYMPAGASREVADV